MRKQTLFMLILIPLMAAVGALRYWQRQTAFEPDTGLLISGRPATWAIIALTALAAAALFFLARQAVDQAVFGSYLAAFSAPGWTLVVFALAGGLLVAAGVVGLSVWRQGLESATVVGRVASVSMIPTGFSMGLVGWLNCQRQESRGRFAWPLLLPGYCGCVWLVWAYQSQAADPNTMAYVFYLLGAVCAVSACYFQAAFSFERPRPMVCLWTGGMGLTLLTAGTVDMLWTGAKQPLLVCLSYGVYLLAQTGCLLWRCARPAQLEPWTPPEPDAPEEAENEVTDHE